MLCLFKWQHLDDILTAEFCSPEQIHDELDVMLTERDHNK